MRLEFLLLLLLLFLLFISGCIFFKNCGEDISCFLQSAKDCSPSKVNLIHEGNNIRITLRGIKEEKCLISLKIEDVSDEIKEKYPLESMVAVGKTLNCAIPLSKEEYVEQFLKEENFEEYCSGPIKDFLSNSNLKEIISEKLLSENI